MLKDPSTGSGGTAPGRLSLSAPIPRGVVLLALFAAFSFGAIVRVAVAGHFHDISGCTHGFVHGQSQTDGSFHSRTDTCGPTVYPRYCQIDTVNKPEGYRTLIYGDATTTCNIHSWDLWQSATECVYRAEVRADPVYNWHHHRPDNYCG